MKRLLPVFLIALAGLARGQGSAPAPREATSFIDALLKIAGRFQTPLAVEWVKSPDTLKPIPLSERFSTSAEGFDAVVGAYTGYTWQLENGIAHVFQKTMVNDPRNPLNVVVAEVPDRSWIVRDADNFLFQAIGQAVRSTGPKPLAVISTGGSEPRFRLAGNNAPVRELLNQVITSSRMKIWVATFPDSSPLTAKGFWETTPMYDPRYVQAEDQPFWIFLRWGDIPWKRLESLER